MTVAMRKLGFVVGQKKVRTAMQVMGIEAIYPKPNLSAGNKQHKKFPYLLRGLIVDRSDQAWAADITYIPLTKGFGYLFAIIDWYSRYVIEWELSNLLDTEFCMEALQRSLWQKRPEIFNSPYAKWAPTISQPVLNRSRSSSKNAIRFAFISN